MFKLIPKLSITSLAMMRIGIACIILLDLWIRASDISVFYTDQGVLPSDELPIRFWKTWQFSLHTLYSSESWVAFLFVLAACFAIMLLIGFKTRIATLASWLLIMSLHNRNPLILQGGDDLLRVTLFWALFLPWGSRFSLDASKWKAHQQSHVAINQMAALAFILQICYVYCISALEKGPEWYSDFTAMHYVYQLDQIAYRPALFLAHYPMILKVLTLTAWLFELLIPILIFFPRNNVRYRTIGALLIIGFHLWNGFTIQVGFFFAIGIITAIGLIPEAAICKALKWLGIQTSQPIEDPIQTNQNRFQKFRNCTLSFTMSVMVIYVFAWNYSNLSFVPYVLSKTLKKPGQWLSLQQNWGMFAPGVLKDDGWYIYQGVTQHGDTIDISKGYVKPDFRKPEYLVSTFKNDRWRKFSEQYMLDTYSGIRGYYCQYLTHEWNKKNPDKQLKELRIIYMTEMSPAVYQDVIPIPKTLCACY